MSVVRGPLRIVFIRSGNYDYADLDLSGAVHLVAGNNVGKTTLIAALQFLFIDDVRHMHFSHEWKETRRHYFPHVGSMVLFECMTPTGFQVIAFRGLGPVQGFEFERLIYTGAYDRADFLDGRQVRTWDEVSRRLVGRDLRVPIEPRHLRASLLSSGDMKGAPFGLVPLARTGNYESFRFLFRNLLRLSRIEQDQLKRLFIDISRPRLRQVEVDLRRDYAELFSRVEREAESVVALQRVAPSIRHLVEHFERRSELRAELVTTWRRLERELGRLRAETEREAVAQAQEHTRLHDEQQALATKEAELRAHRRDQHHSRTRGERPAAASRPRGASARVSAGMGGTAQAAADCHPRRLRGTFDERDEGPSHRRAT